MLLSYGSILYISEWILLMVRLIPLYSDQLDLLSQNPGDVVLTKHPGMISALNRKGQDLIRSKHLLSGIYSKTNYAHVLICASPGVFIHANGKVVLAQHANTIEDFSYPNRIIVFRHPQMASDFDLQRRFMESCDRYLKQKYGFVYGKSPITRFIVKDANVKKFCSELVALLLGEVGLSVSRYSPSETLPTDIFHYCTLEKWIDVTEQYYYKQSEIKLLRKIEFQWGLEESSSKHDHDQQRVILPDQVAIELKAAYLGRNAWMKSNFNLEQIIANSRNTISELASAFIPMTNQKHTLYLQICRVAAISAYFESAALKVAKSFYVNPNQFPCIRDNLVMDMSDINTYYSWIDQLEWSKSNYKIILESTGFSVNPYDDIPSGEEIIQLELLTKKITILARSLFVETKLWILLSNYFREMKFDGLPNNYNNINSENYLDWLEDMPILNDQDTELRKRVIENIDLSAFTNSDAIYFRSQAITIVQLHNIYSLFKISNADEPARKK